MNSRDLGYYGERLASSYLDSLGYRLIENNFRSRFGEIDIVCEKDDVYYFVEVKVRRNTYKFTDPIESISANKFIKIRKTINYYFKQIRVVDTCFDILAFSILFKRGILFAETEISSLL